MAKFPTKERLETSNLPVSLFVEFRSTQGVNILLLVDAFDKRTLPTKGHCSKCRTLFYCFGSDRNFCVSWRCYSAFSKSPVPILHMLCHALVKKKLHKSWRGNKESTHSFDSLRKFITTVKYHVYSKYRFSSCMSSPIQLITFQI